MSSSPDGRTHRHPRLIRTLGGLRIELCQSAGMEVRSVQRQQCMLDGISPDAADIMIDIDCQLTVFDTPFRMAPYRPIEASRSSAMFGGSRARDEPQGRSSVTFITTVEDLSENDVLRLDAPV